MNQNATNDSSRREFLKNTGRIAAVSALAGVAIPRVHAAEDNTIQLALIGCGGRGTGAAADAMSVQNNGPIKLVAMADAFEDRLDSSHKAISKQFADQVDVPRRSQVRRPGRLPEGHGLSEARRCGHFCHALGVRGGCILPMQSRRG